MKSSNSISPSTWRAIRRWIRLIVFGGGMIAIVCGLCCSALLLASSFWGLDGQSEFTQLTGAAAKRRLSNWPNGVSDKNVRRVSYRTEYTRDSFSTWYRIQLTPEAAATWASYIHKQHESDSRQMLHELHEGLEGVHRFVSAPPELRWEAEETPDWWAPPHTEFRATEVMLWYTRFDSGVGCAVYSTFDPATNTLWIYDYAAQHDVLWSPGAVPHGQVFSTMEDGSSSAIQSRSE